MFELKNGFKLACFFFNKYILKIYCMYFYIINKILLIETRKNKQKN